MKGVSIWCVALAAAVTLACADKEDDRIGDNTAVGANTAAADRNAPPPAGGDDRSANRDVGADAPLAGMAGGSDRTFVEHMAAGSIAEVKLGELAAERAASADVKAFARRMIADHSKANDELKPVAAQLNATLPTRPDEKHQQLYDRLSQMEGEQFDREYMKAMVEGHQDVLDQLERHAGTSRMGDRGVGTAGDTAAPGRNASSEWASKTMPTVREHLDQAKRINEKMGGK